MISSKGLFAIFVMATLCASSLATADMQSNVESPPASETQQQQQQQQVQPQQQQQQASSSKLSLPYSQLNIPPAETVESSSNQEDYKGSSTSDKDADIAQDDQAISISTRPRPKFVGKRARDSAQIIGERPRRRPQFVGKRPRGRPQFVGKRPRRRPQFVGKRPRRRPQFVGRSINTEWFPAAYTRKRSVDMKETVDTPNVMESVHSVAKRAIRPVFVGKKAFRYQARKAPWFIGKRADNTGDSGFYERSVFDDGWNEDEDEELASFLSKRRRPRFIGKRNPYTSFMADTPIFVGQRARPKFVGKRLSEIVGSRNNAMDGDEFLFDDGQFDSENDKRGRPKFIGRRSQQDLDIANFLAQISREAELNELRQRIAKEKRYGPQFIGKRDELEQEGSR